MEGLCRGYLGHNTLNLYNLVVARSNLQHSHSPRLSGVIFILSLVGKICPYFLRFIKISRSLAFVENFVSGYQQGWVLFIKDG
jgi:hypothetical protein